MAEDQEPTSPKQRQSESRSSHPPGLSANPPPGRSALKEDKSLLEQVKGQQGQGQGDVEEGELENMEANKSEEKDDGGTSERQGHPKVPAEPSPCATLPPLQNPVILTNLFQLCPPGLLAQFRLVCRQWWDLSFPTWRGSFPLRFVLRNGEIFMFHGDAKPKPYTPFPMPGILGKKFEADSSSSNPKPYRQYMLYSCNYQVPRGRDALEPFWEAIGKNLTSLELSHLTEIVDAEDFRKIVFKECPNLQRLDIHCSFPFVRSSREVYKETDYKGPVHGEHLHLKSLSIRLNAPGYDWIGRLPISWLEIFSHFQSLTSLSFSTEERSFIEEVETENMLGALAIANKRNRRKFCFKRVNISYRSGIGPGAASPNKFVLMQEMNLPLHSLSIWVSPELDNWAVQGLLEVYCGELRKVDVIGGYLPWTFPCHVKMESLEELMISGVALENMDFLEHTPNLKTLRIAGPLIPTEMIHNSCEAHLEHVKLLKLEALRLECEIGTVEEVKRLAKWMPNVRKLTMRLSNQQFAIVCENWTGLEELCVLGNYLTDEGVTGRLLEKPELGVVHPNITSLQNLKIMTFWSIRLTQASVQYGFLHLPCLERLQTLMGMGLPPELRDALKAKNICLFEHGL